MKKRIISLLLLLAIALTACTSAELSKDGKDADSLRRPDQTVVDDHELDIGVTEGNTYKNASLGFTCEFPEGWYLYNDEDIASYNGLSASTYDRSAAADAIESGQVVVFFIATQNGSVSSVNINANKNQVPDMDEKALLEASIPLVQSQMEQLDGMERVTCSMTEAAFCGRTLPALAVTCETADSTLYETILYLLDGDYIYTLTVACGQESEAADILDCFSAIN